MGTLNLLISFVKLQCSPSEIGSIALDQSQQKLHHEKGTKSVLLFQVDIPKFETQMIGKVWMEEMVQHESCVDDDDDDDLLFVGM